jgi:hypothetical protein
MGLKEWVKGQKHSDTPLQIFVNVYECDRVRRILLARCKICDHVVSRDPNAVRELVFDCDNKACQCHKPMGSRSHEVCNLCYDMHHSLYVNYKLQNVNYFKQIDDKIKSDYEKFKKKE